jgi:hypothetical protein
MVFNATFNNISVIFWRSVLLVEETAMPGENHKSLNWFLAVSTFIMSYKFTVSLGSCCGWWNCRPSASMLNETKNYLTLRFQFFKLQIQQYFSYILAVSFIGGGNRNTRRKPQVTTNYCRKFVFYVYISSLM